MRRNGHSLWACSALALASAATAGETSETVTAGGASRRTCFGYDWTGNKISTTRPNGLCQ